MLSRDFLIDFERKVPLADGQPMTQKIPPGRLYVPFELVIQRQFFWAFCDGVTSTPPDGSISPAYLPRCLWVGHSSMVPAPLEFDELAIWW
jgi:hypothetical protein